MSKLVCPWDMCVNNTRCHRNVEVGECTADEVKLAAIGDREDKLICNNFKSAADKSKEELNND